MKSVSDLTPRELEILRGLVAGKTDRGIAENMTIREKTVEFHLDHIYTKTGARTRLLAGIRALRQGMQSQTRDTQG